MGTDSHGTQFGCIERCLVLSFLPGGAVVKDSLCAHMVNGVECVSDEVGTRV